jgi:hypothetical protein
LSFPRRKPSRQAIRQTPVEESDKYRLASFLEKLILLMYKITKIYSRQPDRCGEVNWGGGVRGV